MCCYDILNVDRHRQHAIQVRGCVFGQCKVDARQANTPFLDRFIQNPDADGPSYGIHDGIPDGSSASTVTLNNSLVREAEDSSVAVIGMRVRRRHEGLYEG